MGRQWMFGVLVSYLIFCKDLLLFIVVVYCCCC